MRFCFVSDLDILLSFTNLPPLCSLIHIIECPCLYATQYKHKLQDYIKTMNEFQEVEKRIVRKFFIYSNNRFIKCVNVMVFTIIISPLKSYIKFFSFKIYIFNSPLPLKMCDIMLKPCVVHGSNGLTR